MKTKRILPAIISTAVLVISAAAPLSASAYYGHEKSYSKHHAGKHIKRHDKFRHYKQPRGHAYGRYKKHDHHHYRYSHKHHDNSYYPGVLPVLGFIYYNDWKDNRYSYR